MSTRARAVEKKPDETYNLEQILDGEGGGDLPMLLAPYVVRNSASGAAGLRAQCTLFRTRLV